MEFWPKMYWGLTEMMCTDLSEILRKHNLWLRDKDGGECANLEGANLEGAKLKYATLKGATLKGANLEDTDLECTNLRAANLRFANLKCADLVGTDLAAAKLEGANIDCSTWPLWCGSLKAHVDDRIAVQLLYHTLSVVQYSPYVSEDIKRTLLTPDVVDVANRFHHVDECGELEIFNGGKEA